VRSKLLTGTAVLAGLLALGALTPKAEAYPFPVGPRPMIYPSRPPMYVSPFQVAAIQRQMYIAAVRQQIAQANYIRYLQLPGRLPIYVGGGGGCAGGGGGGDSSGGDGGGDGGGSGGGGD
jgi:hypothetical protein